MTPEEKEEYESAARFMRQAVAHIDKATNNQKRSLLKALLAQPPVEDAVTMAENIWKGLTEKEFMTLCARLQKQYDPEFWTFSTRLR